MKYLYKTLSILAMAALPVTSFAASHVHIGIVDMQQAFFQSKAAMKYMEKTKATYQPKLDALAVERDKIQAAQEKLKKNALTLSKQELEKQQSSLDEEKKAFLEKVQNMRQEKNSSDLDEFKSLEPQLKQAIHNVAEEGKYTLVLDKAVVLYENDSSNITKKVINELNNITEHANKGKK